MSSVLWVAFGSAVGGMARYWCSGAVARRYGERFPWGTLVVNIVGSFVIGLFAAWGSGGRDAVDPRISQFVMAGICGGYTTFSSFSLQTLNLARDGQWGGVWTNIALSAGLCLAAVWLGFAAALVAG